jgi:branched-chain amino acid transport system permease protein
LGISVLMANGVLLIMGPNYHVVSTPYRFNALTIGPIAIPLARLIAFAMAVLLAAVLGLFLTKTDLGRALRATAENPDWAVLMGIDSAKIFMISFGIGVALAAAAGALMTPFYNTYPTVGENFGMLAYVVVVLGGLGNVPGAVLGALVIGVTESLTAQFVALDLALFGVYVIFILVLLFRPTGIIGGGRIF